MFRKYPKIMNANREILIDKFFKNYDNKVIKFVAHEKLDGANISINATLNENGDIEVNWYKRTGEAEPGFFCLDSIVKTEDVQKFQASLKLYLQDLSGISSVTFFGELLGPKIQCRVNYGENKIVFYDVFFREEGSDTWITVNDNIFKDTVTKFCNYYDVPYSLFNINDTNKKVWEVPKDTSSEDYLKETVIPEAQEFIKGKDSYLTPDNHEGENEIEGVVIKGHINKEVLGVDERFCIKVKNKKFSENKSNKKPKEPNSDAYNKWLDIFEEYINENRVRSVFSKEGQIQSTNEISKYIKLIMNDAREDFLVDYGEEFMADTGFKNEKERNKLFGKAGRSAASYLLKFI